MCTDGVSVTVYVVNVKFTDIEACVYSHFYHQLPSQKKKKVLCIFEG